jgi:hypothetical protein
MSSLCDGKRGHNRLRIANVQFIEVPGAEKRLARVYALLLPKAGVIQPEEHGKISCRDIEVWGNGHY